MASSVCVRKLHVTAWWVRDEKNPAAPLRSASAPRREPRRVLAVDRRMLCLQVLLSLASALLGPACDTECCHEAAWRVWDVGLK